MQLSIGQCATLACLLEANAPKPGNVHRGADFDDLTLNDLAASAVAIAPAMQAAARQGVGPAVLQAIQATRAVTSTNTNLGTVLLLAPLACVPPEAELQSGLAGVLNDLSAEDAAMVYRAINIAQPGGMGHVTEMDIADAPPTSLLDAMQAAAERDMVARQYTNGFAEIFGEVMPQLVAGRKAGWSLPLSIVHAQINLISRHGDSLIARKCGQDISHLAAAHAASVLQSGQPGDESYHTALADFDFWLRSDGRRRNPGTTADLLAAGLFVALRTRAIGPPLG